MPRVESGTLPLMMDGRPARRRALLWSVLLVMACTRVFAGAPELDAHSHRASDPHPHAILAEHDHALDREGPSGDHFHCHSGCGDTPVTVPALATLAASSATPVRSFVFVDTVGSAPPLTHFRPPRP